MAQGAVKVVSDERRYGFITPDEGDKEFSCTSIAGNGFKTLEEGARVTYEATQGRMGMQADNVSRV